MPLFARTLLTLAAVLLLAPAAQAGEPPDAELFVRSKGKCPTLKGKPKVIGIGSSTMKGSLGPMLRRLVKRRKLNLTFVNRGKSSSGLARPDFYDWHAKATELGEKEKPDMWLVSMGTNDYQAVRVGKRKWLRPPTEAWRKAYAEKVRTLLEILSGPDRKRPVVYIGSTAFGRDASRRIGPKLNALIRQEVEKFDGPAIFYDVFKRTADSKNKAAKAATVPGKKPGSKRRIKIFGPDNIHLTRTAVEKLLADPALKLLQDCAGQKPR
ncbi:MAG: hypothetical protein ACI9WU_005131 [Myxococcota bacterium]|jgi:hypothetical protein